MAGRTVSKQVYLSIKLPVRVTIKSARSDSHLSRSFACHCLPRSPLPPTRPSTPTAHDEHPGPHR
jgi:hypothetical protein